MKFVGDYTIDSGTCEKLIALYRACESRGLAVRGRIGRAGVRVIDTTKKDSYDLTADVIPDDLAQAYDFSSYFEKLQGCLQQYVARHQGLRNVGMFRVVEPPVIQRYPPGGGFTMPHFERTGYATTTRMLVWMTYLNDVRDGGGTHFHYQEYTFEARTGRTLIWPSDFTHTHAGVPSPTEEKFIITGWLNFCE